MGRRLKSSSVALAPLVAVCAALVGCNLLPLNAPTFLRVVEVTEHAIELAWDDTSFNEEGFYLERRVVDDGDFLQIADVPADSASYTDINLMSATTYEYRIYAYNRNGLSDYSNRIDGTTLTPTVPPAAPSGLRLGTAAL